MTDVCRATKRNGEPCTLPANGPHGLCWAHDPKNAEKRRRGASRGGKARAGTEIKALKSQLSELVEEVLAGELETGSAAVANQLINTHLRALEQERRNKETEELEGRIEALEQAAEQRGERGRSWGA